MPEFWVKSDPPEYHIGYGPDLEFIVVARCLSKTRAEQIAKLLNEDKEPARQALFN